MKRADRRSYFGGVQESRHKFHEDLAELERQALDGLGMVSESLDRAVESLMYQDLDLARMVVADDDRVDGCYLRVRQGLVTMLARQAPVASDLRIVAALLQIMRSIERMGDQCVNVAKLVLLSGHDPPKDEDILVAIEQMRIGARSLVSRATESFAARDVVVAKGLARQQAEVKLLNRAILSRAVEVADDLELREWAMFMILAARAIERIADNTVDIAEQTVFVVTGLFRESAEAAQPA